MLKLTVKQAEKLEDAIENSLIAYCVYSKSQIFQLTEKYGKTYIEGSLSQSHIEAYKSQTYATIESLENLGKRLTTKLVKLGLVEERIIKDDWKTARDDFAWRLAPKTYVQWNLTQIAIDWAIANDVCIEGSATGLNSGCGNCGGTGFIPEYAHVAGGVCFQCNGRG